MIPVKGLSLVQTIDIPAFRFERIKCSLFEIRSNVENNEKKFKLVKRNVWKGYYNDFSNLCFYIIVQEISGNC